MYNESNFIKIRNLIDELVKRYNSVNPYILAVNLDIFIQETNINPDYFKARIYLIDDNLGIMINENFDLKTKKYLLAHELGHALLHRDCINLYGDNGIASERCEYEANLFALELMSRNLYYDFSKFNTDELQLIIDSNLKNSRSVANE